MAESFDQAVDFGDAGTLIGARVRRQVQHLGNLNAQDVLEQPGLSRFGRHDVAPRGHII